MQDIISTKNVVIILVTNIEWWLYSKVYLFPHFINTLYEVDSDKLLLYLGKLRVSA